MLTSAVPLLGRVLMSVIFIGAGYGKLGNASGTIGYIASHGMPLPEVAYGLSVATELGGGLLILFGLLTRPVAALMAVFCVLTGVIFHYIPADQNMMIHFMKNIAMAGGFLQLVAWGAGAWSLDALLSARRGSAIPARA
jgi:putative oxidoreductase